MDRRKAIFEKLKCSGSKFNKLTLKQGNNETITLNLKEDLLNEKVIIGDKVLQMLENLAEKNLKKDPQQQQQHQHQQPEANTSAKKLAESSNNEMQSPKKRVKFNEKVEFRESDAPKTSSSTTNSQLNTHELNILNEFIHASEQLQQHQHHHQEANHEIDLTSGSFFSTATKTSNKKLPIFTKQTTQDTQDTDTESNSVLCRICLLKCQSERALHDHVTRIHGGGSDVRRSSKTAEEFDESSQTDTESTQTRVPKPNVAIRVAKVAYYNSKNEPLSSLSSKASNIFINGIRGNFFSQERLPLKSCKIKMKLKESADEQSEEPTKSEINAFFRSLLVYIPFDVCSVNDLVSREEIKEAKKILLIKVHAIIFDAKEIGIPLAELKKKVQEKSMNLLKEILDILVKEFLVLAVGVVQRVFVAHEFAQPWLISSFKNQKGRNYVTPDDVGENTISKEFKKVLLVPRPWRYVDGLLNRQSLHKMLESIILFLKTYPSASFERISAHFSPALQPVHTLELLEMLEKMLCVRSEKMRPECECNLKSSFDSGSSWVTDDDLLEGDEIVCYECTSDSMFIMKKLFNNITSE